MKPHNCKNITCTKKGTEVQQRVRGKPAASLISLFLCPKLAIPVSCFFWFHNLIMPHYESKSEARITKIFISFHARFQGRNLLAMLAANSISIGSYIIQSPKCLIVIGDCWCLSKSYMSWKICWGLFV